MGLFKKVFRPVRKIAKKIIPKEIRPALPYIAAFYGGPAMAGSSFMSGIGNTALRNAISKGLISGATAAGTDEDANILRSAALGAAPDLISGGLGNVAGRIDPNLIADSDSFVQVGDMAAKTAGTLSRASEGIKGASALKTIGAQTAIDQSAKFAEIRQDEIDEYNRSLQEQGVLDKTKRRTAIFNIYKNAGYEDDYVNSMLDRYGYAMGGRIGFANGGYRGKAEAAMGLTTMKDLLKGKTKAPIIEIDEDKEVVLGEDDDDDDRPIIREKPNYAQAMKDAMTGVEAAFGIPFAGVEAAEFKRFARGGEVEEEGIMSKIVDSMGDDYDYFTRIKLRENLKQGETNEDAIDLAEQEAMGMVKEKYGFARGGEVEIEEQVDDLGIMDLMKDQGIPYGEQASYGFDDAMGETFEMFLDYKKKGTIPMEMEFDEFLELLQGRKEQGIKGTQVASGYKDDIEEMYEQYVFEMEEQGLQPMDFASFLRQARSGMANGGKVKRRKKGEPADEVIETEEEIFLDKMPRPKRKGIMEAAGGGSVGSRYSFLINKQKQGILSPDEEQELLMLEMTYADESQGKADGGIMNKNLLNTGMDKDMRGGGFIPEGTKEKADDVPARLSKNEFVMTADAVRAAGGGSVNKGAKKMYDLMYTLEAKV